MILYRWHTWVNQPKFDKQWHSDDVADELQEYKEAEKLVHKWSELSDIVYTVTRARWSGHNFDYPISKRQQIIGRVYMYPKYTSRTLFFRRAGKKAKAVDVVNSVRNPKKVTKLHKIAEENNIDPTLFEEICKAQLKRWPLLP